jgi:hypothetical protein
MEQRNSLAIFFNEERAATEWDSNMKGPTDESGSMNLVEDHSLLREIIERYGITRDGFVHGYVRVFEVNPYFVTEEESLEGDEYA